MKIAMVTDWFAPRIGGIEVHVRELAMRLRQRGHDAVVLTPWPGPNEVSGVPVMRIPVKILPGLGVSISPKLTSHLHRAFVDGRFDVVHGHVSIGSLAAISAGYAGYRAGLPTVGTFHSILGRWSQAYAWAAPVLGWKDWPFRAAAVSDAVAADLHRLLPHRRVDILPPAIDPTVWKASPSEYKLGKLRLVTTARLHRRKRVDALLKILADVRERAGTGIAVTLEIVGSGSQEANLKSLAGRLGLGDVVRFLGGGKEDDVRALLARADLFVNACDLESFGIAGLEALCAGVPVVARSEGGMSSFVDHGKNGLLLNSDKAMAEALAALAQDPKRMGALRLGASCGIPDLYQWSGAVDRHLSIYQDMIDQPTVLSQSTAGSA